MGAYPTPPQCEKDSPCIVTLQFDSSGNPNWTGSESGITVVPGDTVTIRLLGGGVFAKHSCTWNAGSHKGGFLGLQTIQDKGQREVPIDRVTFVVDSKVLSNIAAQVLGSSSDANPSYAIKRPGLLVIGRHEDAELPNTSKPNPNATCVRTLLPTQSKFEVTIKGR
jgi:hypothetical protein